jgi:G:T/U-mismatch repair DNA glycosylase
VQWNTFSNIKLEHLKLEDTPKKKKLQYRIVKLQKKNKKLQQTVRRLKNKLQQEQQKKKASAEEECDVKIIRKLSSKLFHGNVKELLTVQIDALTKKNKEDDIILT